MTDSPLAYHLTFGTYGTRLHGDPRGTVDRSRNRPGDPILGTDARRWKRERQGLRYPPILLSQEQRRFAETAIPAVCSQGGWTLHTCSASADHVHVLLTASADGLAVRKWLKRWLGEALSKEWPLPAGQSWWAESGSVKWVWAEEYLASVHEYIRGQRTLG